MLKYLESVAFWLILLFAVMTDGIVEAFGMRVWMVIAAVVIIVSYIMIEIGRNA